MFANGHDGACLKDLNGFEMCMNFQIKGCLPPLKIGGVDIRKAMRILQDDELDAPSGAGWDDLFESVFSTVSSWFAGAPSVSVGDASKCATTAVSFSAAVGTIGATDGLAAPLFASTTTGIAAQSACMPIVAAATQPISNAITAGVNQFFLNGVNSAMKPAIP